MQKKKKNASLSKDPRARNNLVAARKPDMGGMEQRGHAQSLRVGLAHPRQGASQVVKNSSVEKRLDGTQLVAKG